MPSIIRLSQQVADLIAAGEVVERPASAAKELIENSLDAGASHITVEIQNGGITLLRVTDDGCGIPADEVETAFLRHATSKLRTKEDLEAIVTMGFRGEALAAISAVAKVELLTRTEDAELGRRVVLAGGEVLSNEEAGCPKGTTIVLRDLFFNTPARHKFLKKDVTEAGYVISACQRAALARPDVAFKLIKNGELVLQTPGDGQLRTVIYCLFGNALAEQLLPVSGSHNGVTVSGFVGKPEAARGSRAMQYFWVNDRPVKNVTLQSAIEQAFRQQMTGGRFPVAFLNVTMSPRQVDVNIHPAKTEVKFAREKDVFDAVYYAVRTALSANEPAEMTFVSVPPRKEAETVTFRENPVLVRADAENGRENSSAIYKMHKNSPNAGDIIRADDNVASAGMVSLAALGYLTEETPDSSMAEAPAGRGAAFVPREPAGQTAGTQPLEQTSPARDTQAAGKAEYPASRLVAEPEAGAAAGTAGLEPAAGPAPGRQGFKPEAESGVSPSGVGAKTGSLPGPLAPGATSVTEAEEQARNRPNMEPQAEPLAGRPGSGPEAGFAESRFKAPERLTAEQDAFAAYRPDTARQAEPASSREPQGTGLSAYPRAEQAVPSAGKEGAFPQVKPAVPRIVEVYEEVPPARAERAENRQQAQESEWRFVGEAMGTYIIAERGDALCFMDKHAAHERLVYEKLKKEAGSLPAQLLLEAPVIHLEPKEAAVLLENREVLLSLGFEIEEFGGGSVRLLSVPSVLDQTDSPATLLSELADQLAKGKEPGIAAVDELIAMIACKSAVKARDDSSPKELMYLFTRVIGDETLWHCPHGRPVLTILTRKELEKQFKRLV